MFRRTTQTGNLLYGKISPESDGQINNFIAMNNFDFKKYFGNLIG